MSDGARDRPPRRAAADGAATDGDASTLTAHALTVALGGREVLHQVDLTLARGWTAVIGPNGAGKSTLLRALAGLLAPAGGHVALDGRPLADWPARARATRIGWLSQNAETTGDVAAIDVVRLGRLPHLGLLGTAGPADEAAVRQAMAQTECEALAERRLAALSGGERQRVLLARLLAVQAPVLLLDEPTTHLDAPHQVALMTLLRRLAGRHTIVSVLHDLSLALAADRLVVMRDGRIVTTGDTADPRVHAALADVFDQAVRVLPLDDGWVAVPRVR